VDLHRSYAAIDSSDRDDRSGESQPTDEILQAAAEAIDDRQAYRFLKRLWE